MKYAIVIPDGCADDPQALLGGKTPLAAADTPAMDALAAAGVVGRTNNVPDHLPAGSAVANMSLLGYDPVAHFTGRAPLEAAAQGIELGENDWAVRCNLVTIEDQVMRDFTAGHISTDEAARLLADATVLLDEEVQQFVPGVSYRNLLIWHGDRLTAPFTADTRTTPPHDLTDKSVLEDYPRGPGSELLARWMSASAELLANHPVNAARRAANQRPATHVWLWGLGRRPALRPFAEVYGRQGAMITAVDLLRGLAALVGWQRIDVPGATGYTDTDYAAKGRAAVEALEATDVVCVHVEATDEASHEGDADAKVRAIEQIDRHVVAPLSAALQRYDAWRMLVLPDHRTPLATKTHSHGPVPFVLAGTGIEADGSSCYCEASAEASSLCFDEGWKLMRHFIGSPEVS